MIFSPRPLSNKATNSIAMADMLFGQPDGLISNTLPPFGYLCQDTFPRALVGGLPSFLNVARSILQRNGFRLPGEGSRPRQLRCGLRIASVSIGSSCPEFIDGGLRGVAVQAC